MKNINKLLTLFLVGSFVLIGCKKEEETSSIAPQSEQNSSSENQQDSSDDQSDNSILPVEPKARTILNGGFETADLSGWTVEYGTAFTNDSISSKKTFSYSYDKDHKEIEIGKAGNWYLDGKGFTGTYSHSRIGAIRSTTFKLTGDGTISMKIAGASITRGKGEGAAYKDDTNLCYVGIYTVKDDRLVYRQTNEYFVEHTEDYVDVNKYNNGVYHTDNFNDYYVDLSEYLNEEMYIRIVDNDQDAYYGYISVDDIRIGDEEAQAEGPYFVKERHYIDDVEAASIYDIKNGDFETGSLAGWEVLEGQAFSNEGVNEEATWWNEGITYDKDGKYHYGHYKPEATGIMCSSLFTLGGSGFVSFKLGGCSNNDLTYLSFYVVEENEDIEVARYSNRKYWNFQFPYVANGMKLLNMVEYKADLHEYLGKTMYIEVVDKNTSSDELGCITLDSIVTYYQEEPMFYTLNHYAAISMISVEIEDESQYQVLNGTFETGDLTGWETSWTNDASRIGFVSDRNGWWMENLPYNKKGTYLFTGADDEANTGYLKSSSFEVGGIGKMSFLMGGGKNPKLCYISLIDADTEVELARYYNAYFHDLGIDLVNRGSNMMNMVQYVADISDFIGQNVYLKVVDNAVNDWGLIAIDGFITYYEDESSLPNNYYNAIDILPKEEIVNEYQVANGGFESGDLSSWTISGNIGNIAADIVWWNEWYNFDKVGIYFFNGWYGAEDQTGTLVSSSFKVGGINKMSFRLGGGKNTSLCKVEIIDASTSEVLASYGNYKFMPYPEPNPYHYNGQPIDLAKDNVYLANMVTYIADLSDFTGRDVKIRLVDNAVNDWGLLFADDFVTYYENEADLPVGLEAHL